MITLLVFSLLISSSNPTATRAAPNTPEYYGWLSQYVATWNTYRITLTIRGLGGVAPPPSKWYGPDESQVSATCLEGQVVRDREYDHGSLYEVRDYFYISACDREPGEYRVTVGGEINYTFTIEPQTYYNYLPIILKPPPTQPPSVFAKLSPASGATGQLLSPTLDWDDSGGAASYAYCYDTTNDSACTNWVDAGATSQARIRGLSVDTTYFWQARAANSLGTTYADGDSTAYWSFSTSSGSVTPSEMILIPAGDFQMGCDPDHNGGVSCYTFELPLHTVYLDAYRIDKYEVTNTQYAQCVIAGACSAPSDSSSYTRPSYYGNPDYDEYPVIYVTWQDAYDYCAWADQRLPSEAEWEKAARGTSLQTYPWGDGEPTCTLANLLDCVGDTSPVGDYPTGASPFGVLDMAGNVWEWVNDWYDEAYYQESPASNPPGPISGTYKVYRGGSYGSTTPVVSRRVYYKPDIGYRYKGFRCAAPPES